MEDVAVAAPLPTPPVVGRVPAATELPPRPRERAVSAEPPPRPRERAVGAEKPPRPRVRAGAAAAASNAEAVDPFFFLAPTGVDISAAPKSKARRVRWRWMRGTGESDELEHGDMAGGDDLARKHPARPNRRRSRARRRLLPTRDPGAPSPLDDEAVQRSLGRLFRLGARDKPVDGALVSPLHWGVSAKSSSKRREKDVRCTCPNDDV